jgi:ABC-type transport system involved in multi-copper enzyme maturation permease subunit
MSTSAETTRLDSTGDFAASGGKMRLWAQQVRVLLYNESIKNAFSLRALLVYLLAVLPLLLVGALVAFAPAHRALANPARNLMIYSGIYEGLILRTVVFFGCAWTFMNLVRGEVVDKSLHYYFLSPVRREVLLVGKYLSGVMTTTLLFGTISLITFALMCLPRGVDGAREYLLAGPGLSSDALGTEPSFSRSVSCFATRSFQRS